ncbi:DUF4157 domain-containing protein [Rhodohalobacter sp. SW132]|uniref:eCIS core domain-containing protein n=1 Tax=Rhodohalobacter sp. SW132 TaxID=2293433 RepID=UPI000E279A91|nr:DUF4157 domain-containing protein [Rhodohalobacter sp. SW132]REL24480.1 DUF4157 domain-containing protein [Rhodohalobacter sp. SW132]
MIAFNTPHKPQPKLKIGSPNDKYEQQADRVADAVVNTPGQPLQMQAMEDDEELQMKCKECEEEERLQMKCKTSESIQMAPSGAPQQQPGYTSAGVSNKISSLKGTGQKLPSRLNRELSHKIGTDFSDVSIHKGDEASSLSKQIGARAFTHEKDIYFNSGEYKPDSSEGKHLLAHELTHVVQQDGYEASSPVQRQSPTTESGNPTSETLNQEQRNWLYQRIEHRLGSAFTTFAIACERHRDELRAAAARQEEAASLVLDVVLTFASPGLGRLLQQAVSRAVHTGASLMAYRIALGAINRSDQIVSAAGSIAKLEAKHGFQAVLSRSAEENYVDELYQAMRVAIDHLHQGLPEMSDEELSIIYTNYDPEIATLNYYVAEIGRLISLYQSQVAPIGQRTDGVYGLMKARWVEGSVWRALALTGEGRYYNQDRRPHFIAWISPNMRTLAERATEAVNQNGINSVHYQDLNLTGADGERALAMLDSEYSFLYQCGMVVERSRGVPQRQGAACPGCHGENTRTLTPEPNLNRFDSQAWQLFQQGEQTLVDTERLREWIERDE